MIPHPTHRPGRPVYENGLFAAPWAVEPMLPPVEARPGHGFGAGFAPSLGPQGARHHENVSLPGMEQSDFMNAIRDQAIFAWALTGINGALAEYGHGKPLGESLPKDGLPIWASDPSRSLQGEGQKSGGSSGNGNGNGDGDGSTPTEASSRAHIFGDPGLGKSGNG